MNALDAYIDPAPRTRGFCPRCQKWRQLRVNGSLRQHGPGMRCPGGGQPATPPPPTALPVVTVPITGALL